MDKLSGKKPALVYSFIIQKLPVSGFLKDSEIFTMLHFCLRFFCIQVFCLHLLQLNSIATNKSWNACFASKPVLQISSYVHTLIHIVGLLADEYFIPDVNVTAQRPFLMCISAKKQGPPWPLYFVAGSAVDGTLQTPGMTSFYQRDLHEENERWHPLFPLLIK